MHWFIPHSSEYGCKWTKQKSYLLRVLHCLYCWIMWVRQITDVLQLYSPNYILIKLHYDSGLWLEQTKGECTSFVRVACILAWHYNSVQSVRRCVHAASLCYVGRLMQNMLHPCCRSSEATSRTVRRLITACDCPTCSHYSLLSPVSVRLTAGCSLSCLQEEN